MWGNLLLGLVILPGVVFGSHNPECGSSFQCFGSEVGCLKNGGCTMLVAYQHNETSNQTNFMIQGSGMSSDNYVALGISTDGGMGSDMVFVCTNGNAPTVLTTWNNGKSNVPATNVNILNKSCAVTNTLMTCNFSVADIISPMVNGNTYNLNLATNKYFLLLAAGTLSGTTLYRHFEVTTTESAVDLKYIGSIGSENNHGHDDANTITLSRILACLLVILSIIC